MTGRIIFFAIAFSIIGGVTFLISDRDENAERAATEPATTMVATKDGASEENKDKGKSETPVSDGNVNSANESISQSPETPADDQADKKIDLEQLEEAPVSELIETAKASADPNIRAAAITHLGELQEDPGIIEAYISSLKDKDPQVRKKVLREFLSTDQLPPADILGKMALNDPDQKIRKEAINVLAFRHGLSAQKEIEAVMNGPDPQLRAHAAKLLDYIRSH